MFTMSSLTSIATWRDGRQQQSHVLDSIHSPNVSDSSFLVLSTSEKNRPWGRVCYCGIRNRLQKRFVRPPLPSIVLANLCSMIKKIDAIRTYMPGTVMNFGRHRSFEFGSILLFAVYVPTRWCGMRHKRPKPLLTVCMNFSCSTDGYCSNTQAVLLRDLNECYLDAV